MKKIIPILVGMACISLYTKAQDFSQARIELGANYTMYKGELQKKTPGVKLRFSVPFSEKIAAGLSFTYHLPIKVASSVGLSGGGSTASEIVYNFKTIGLDANYYFKDEEEEGFTPYGTIGLSYIMVSYKENVKGSIPSGEEATDMIPSESKSGFGLNFGLGAQYSFGQPKVFGEAGIVLPANKVQNDFVSNPIPAHFVFNVGVRFALGSGK
jgi:opacity protein-like surface antigen